MDLLFKKMLLVNQSNFLKMPKVRFYNFCNFQALTNYASRKYALKQILPVVF